MKPIVALLGFVSFFHFTLFAQVNLDSGLVAYYPFHEGSLTDESTFSNDAQAFGPVDTTDRFGVPNQAYYFDGSDDYLEVASHPSIDSVDAYSLTFWVNIDAWFINQWAAILAKSNNSSLEDPTYRFVFRQNRLFMGRDSCGQIDFAEVPELDTWIFCALTYDQQHMNLYLDSVCVTSDSFLCEEAIIPNNYPLIIGRDDPGVTERFNGSLDDLRIYNRALSKEEVLTLYDNSTTSTDARPDISLNIGPNPNLGQWTVEASSARLQHIQAFDLQGRKLAVDITLSSHHAILQTSYRGLLLLEIQTDQGVVMEKILVK